MQKSEENVIIIERDARIMIEILSNADITRAMKKHHRQYLVGNLALPQELRHIHDDNVEMGITYFSQYQYDPPHYHSKVTEYHMLIRGKAKYIDIKENIEYILQEGDVFVIRPGTPYILKALPETLILFFKFPGGNDKHYIGFANGRLKDWAKSWAKNWDSKL